MAELEDDLLDEQSYASGTDTSEKEDDLWSYVDSNGNVLDPSAKDPPAAAKITSTGVQLLVQRHDVVLLRSDEGDPYVGLIKEFKEDPDTDTPGFIVLWMERPSSFSPESLPRDVQTQEIFLTDKEDWNPLSVILGRVNVFSYADYKVKFAQKNLTNGRNEPAFSNFLCRRACLVTESKFSRLFDWYEWYNQEMIDYDFFGKLMGSGFRKVHESPFRDTQLSQGPLAHESPIHRQSLSPTKPVDETMSVAIDEIEDSPPKRRRRLRFQSDDNQPVPTVSLLLAQHKPHHPPSNSVEMSEEVEVKETEPVQEVSTPSKRKRGRPRKMSAVSLEDNSFSLKQETEIEQKEESFLLETDETPTKRKRGRPRKLPGQQSVPRAPTPAPEIMPDNVKGRCLRQKGSISYRAEEVSADESSPPPGSARTPTKRGRGRPRRSAPTTIPEDYDTGGILTGLDLSSVTPTKLHSTASRSLPVTPSRRTPTPRRKSAVKLTPLPSRTFSPANSASPYWAARTRLHVSAVPETLPCRENEFNEIYVTLEAAVTASTGCCVYISGTPGTGKTATVRQVMASLESTSQAGNLRKFLYLEINGLKVTDPPKAYEHLWELIANENLTANNAVRRLEDRFNDPHTDSIPIVVLMDELDQLVTKNQTVMYNFFNWPSLPHSHLVVVAVANTMDLPERTLSNKISSRLGLTRIQFLGYTYDQLKTIIATRLQGFVGTTISPEAIEFASRKIASVSGDARRALDICRRAVELADPDLIIDKTPSKKGSGGPSITTGAVVKIEHIRNAINEATSSPLNHALKTLPLASKIFLRSLMSISSRTGIAEVIVENILQECDRICKTGSQAARLTRVLYRDDKIRFQGFFSAAVQLQAAGIIAQQRSRSQMQAKVKLIVDQENVSTVLKPDFASLR